MTLSLVLGTPEPHVLPAGADPDPPIVGSVGYEAGAEVVLPPWPMGELTARVYRRLGILTAPDAAHGWVLASIVAALCAPLEQIDQLAAADDQDRTGWERALNPDLCPAWMLGWLGGVLGTRIPAGLTEAQTRELLRLRPARKRGQIGAMLASVLPLLTGARRMQVRERYDPEHAGVDSPDDVTIRIHEDDAPTGLRAEIVRRLREAAPTGMRGGEGVHVLFFEGRDWTDVLAGYSTWGAVVAAEPTWQSLIDGGN